MELELKFDVDAAEAERLLERLGPDEPARRETLTSVYFDTPDARLRRNGLVLRIRSDGRRKVQAVKSRGANGGFQRGEWEAPVVDLRPDFAAVAQTPLVEICGREDFAALQPVFKVCVERVSRVVAIDGAEVEAAFDRGEVRLNGSASAVCELELELKSGEAAALFDLARQLVKTTKLELSFITKADRGYGLLDPELAGAASDPTIDPKGSAAAAFQAAAAAALAQMSTNARLVGAAPTVRAVHQLRVGVRRLRSAISLFAAMLADAEGERVKTELRWLSGELTAARNLDVFIEHAFKPAAARLADTRGMPALGDSLTQAREAAYARAAAAIGSPRFRSLMLETALWAQFGPWSVSAEPQQTARRDRSARKTAADLLARRFDKVVKAGRKLDQLTPPARHRLRIGAKKLRYACEFFADLYQGGQAKAHAAFVRHVADLQDALGELNDIATAIQVADQIVGAKGAAARDPWRAYAAGVTIGARQAEAPQALKAAGKRLRRLTKAELFW